MDFIPNQVSYVDKVLEVWEQNLPAEIIAPMGTGKKHMATMVAHLYGAEYVFVLSNTTSSIVRWKTILSSFYPLDKIYGYTYNRWTWCETQDLNDQPYTIRIQNPDGSITYESWNDMILNHKIILILDEVARLTMRDMDIVSANIRTILLSNGFSRILSISYTPVDKLTMLYKNIYNGSSTKKAIHY